MLPHIKTVLPSIWLACILLVRPLSVSACSHAAFLSAAVMPTATFVSQGIVLTVSGINFNPGDDFGELVHEQAGTLPQELYRNSLQTPSCLFAAQGTHGKSFTSAIFIGGGSVACLLPRILGPGFVSVGISTNGVDNLFFRSEMTISVRPLPKLHHIIGSRIQSSGDPVHVVGIALTPRHTFTAFPGQAVMCGWQLPEGIKGISFEENKVSSGTGGSPGVFVTSALRVCETPAMMSRTAKLFAAAEPVISKGNKSDAKEHYMTSFGPAIMPSDPPVLVSARPSLTDPDGGTLLAIDSTSYCIGVNSREHFIFRPLLRFGTTWVDMNPHSRPMSERIQEWRSVSPAYVATGIAGVSLAIAYIHYGSHARNLCGQRPFGTGRDTAHTDIPFRVAITAESALSKWINGGYIRPESIEEMGIYYLTAIGELAETDFHHTSSPRAELHPDVWGVMPLTGAVGGGGIVWVSGSFSLLRSPESDHLQGAMTCTFGFADVRLVFISSALVACEAPTLSSTLLPMTVSLNVRYDHHATDSFGAYTYLQNMIVSKPQPDTGPSAGGTKVIVTLSRADQLSTPIVVPTCKFGSVLVVGSVSDSRSHIICVAPAASSTTVTFFLTDSKGACVSSGSVYTNHRPSGDLYNYFNGQD